MGKTTATSNLVEELKIMPRFAAKIHAATNKRELELLITKIGDNYGEVPETLLTCLYRRAIQLDLYLIKDPICGWRIISA